MSKGTILYIGNFELPDKGASANRVMTNRLLFRECGYRTVYLGVTKEEQFEGIRRASFDADVYERAYPSSTKVWLERLHSLKDILDVAQKYEDIRFVVFYNAPFSLVRKAHRHFQNSDVKVLYDCTEWNTDTEGNKLKRLYKKYDTHQIRHNLDKVVDGLIVISSLMKKSYQRVPIIQLPPLVDVESDIWNQERNRTDSDFEFCYAGDPGKKDDLCVLIDAFLRMERDDVKLCIIGVEKESFMNDHQEYASMLNKEEKKVSFLGRVPHKAVIQKLISTDCFVFIRESNLRNNAGFPTKFAEAYTSGARIIATNISDIAEYKADSIRLLTDIKCETIVVAMETIIASCKSSGLRNSFDYRKKIYITQSFIEAISKKTKGNTK